MLEPNQRLKNAHAWWIASELVRRHPSFLITEEHPLDGFYDGLAIHDPFQFSSGQHVYINRFGSVHVLGEGPSIGLLGLSEALALDDPFDAVRQAEEAAQWSAPEKTPPTNGRTLTYRVLARVLLAAVNDPQPWDVRRTWSLEGGLFDGPVSLPPKYFELFPLSHGLLEALRKQNGPYRDPVTNLWTLLKGDKPVALVSSSGHVATPSGFRALLPTYRRFGSNMTSTIADAFGDVLR